jgi:hypothetical protein
LTTDVSETRTSIALFLRPGYPAGARAPGP